MKLRVEEYEDDYLEWLDSVRKQLYVANEMICYYDNYNRRREYNKKWRNKPSSKKYIHDYWKKWSAAHREERNAKARNMAPEQRERIRIKNRVCNLTPEQIEHRRETQREYYKRKKKEKAMGKEITNNYGTLVLQDNHEPITAERIENLILQGGSCQVNCPNIGKVVNQGGTFTKADKECHCGCGEDKMGISTDSLIKDIDKALIEDEKLKTHKTVCAIAELFNAYDGDAEFLGNYFLGFVSERNIKQALVNRGWDVKCTRTKTEEL